MWEALSVLPPCRAVGTTSLLRAFPESLVFGPSPAYVAGLPRTARFRFWKQTRVSCHQNTCVFSFPSGHVCNFSFQVSELHEGLDLVWLCCPLSQHRALPGIQLALNNSLPSEYVNRPSLSIVGEFPRTILSMSVAATTVVHASLCLPWTPETALPADPLLPALLPTPTHSSFFLFF